MHINYYPKLVHLLKNKDDLKYEDDLEVKLKNKDHAWVHGIYVKVQFLAKLNFVNTVDYSTIMSVVFS